VQALVLSRPLHGRGQPRSRSSLWRARPAHPRGVAVGRHAYQGIFLDHRHCPAVLTAALLIAIVGNVLRRFSMTQAESPGATQPPSFLVGGDLRYPLGTDRIGRDLVARLIAGLRMSLTVALIGTMLGAIVGTTIGFIAAHFGVSSRKS